MSKCSRLLDPIFKEIGEIAVKKSSLKTGSPAWENLDNQTRMLYDTAKRIFLQFNPEFQKKAEESTVKKQKQQENRLDAGPPVADLENSVGDCGLTESQRPGKNERKPKDSL